MTGTVDVLALGETMLSLIAVDVPLRAATELRVTHGGAESNACVGLARLGLRTAWVSRLGADAPGDRIMAELGAAGVGVDWVRRDPDRPTGLMLRETSGAPATYHREGSAASALTVEDLADAPVATARAVLVTGITAMLGDGPNRTAVALLDGARGLRVVDPNLRPGLWGSHRASDLVVPLIERADLLIGGETELSTLVGGTGRALAERCRALGPTEVVLKRGAGGAAALADGWIEHRPAPGPNVDPVGAGDAFNAGYLAARLAGRDPFDALDLGARCGAAVAAAVGDTEGLPPAIDLEGGIRDP